MSDSDYFDELLADAERSLTRIRMNLDDLGYEFLDPNPIVFADETDKAVLNNLESRWGTLPLFYKEWYRRFRNVDFSQASSQLFASEPCDVAGLGLNMTLVFRDIKSSLILRDELAVSEMEVSRERNGKEQHFMPTGAIASNCEPKGVWLPDATIDPVLFNDGGGPITFTTELRMAIAGCGFPFWVHLFKRRIISLPLKFGPAWKKIEPALRRGAPPIGCRIYN